MAKDDEQIPGDDEIDSLLADCFDAIEGEERSAFASAEPVPEASHPPVPTAHHPAEADILSEPPPRRRSAPPPRGYSEMERPTIRIHLFTAVAFILAALGAACSLWLYCMPSEEPVPLYEALTRLDQDIERSPQSFAAKAVARAVLEYSLTNGGIAESGSGSPLADLTAKLSVTGEDTELAAEFFVQAVEANVTGAPEDSEDEGATESGEE